jgi:outer membrane lipoprotein-sorting protein
MLTLTGCGSYKLEDAVNDFTKSVESSKSYKINGTMEISSGEEIFTYNIDTYFLKDDFYKVVLVNQTNNHEQVILKNKEGLYVVTPSLNKSFKFDSVWPENSSQAYLLQNLLTDIKNDGEKTLEKTENGYIIKCKVNYPNNDELTYQKIYFDKNMKIEKVEVYSADDIIKIKVTFKSVNLKAKLKEDDFVLEDLIDVTKDENKTTDNKDTNKNENTENKNGTCSGTNCKDNKTCEGNTCDKTTGTLDSIIYPLYIPTNTHLKSSETIDTAAGSRVILTFAGDKNFVIVEETASKASSFEVIPVFGDPLMLDKTIGALSSNSISWNSENVSYYLVSSDLSSNEMVSVAKSLGNSKTVLSTK